jgi:hypothetical protein
MIRARESNIMTVPVDLLGILSSARTALQENLENCDIITGNSNIWTDHSTIGISRPGYKLGKR